MINRSTPLTRNASAAVFAALMATLAAPMPVLAQKSLGGSAGSGPIMSREELRQCLKQQKALASAVEKFEKEKLDLELEKTEVLRNKQAVDAESGSVKADAAKISDVNTRTEALSKRVGEWNERWQAFEKANRSGPVADRERRRLLTEKRAMEEEEKTLTDERGALGGSGNGASQVNAKVDALNARTVAWNERNKRVAKMGEDLAQERDLWASECGNRRYREDDEIAIRNGQ